jgi:cullin-4
MQSTDRGSADSISSTQSTPRKRRLQEQLNGRHTVAQPLSVHDTNTPASKKLKTSSTVTSTMSKSMSSVGTQARPFDLTHQRTAFEPHRGAKKLVIKNLKVSSPDVSKYYADTWNDLETAIKLILNGERTKTPLEKLCKGVEMTCRKGRAGDLFEKYRDLCKIHMEKQILPTIQSSVGSGSVDALRVVHGYWIIWHRRTVCCAAYRGGGLY